VKHVTGIAKTTNVLAKTNEYRMYPTSKYVFGKVKEINQITATVNTIRLLVILLRYVVGFLTARYRSTAKLAMIRDEAVHEIK
jgi:hypothetical protein